MENNKHRPAIAGVYMVTNKRDPKTGKPEETLILREKLELEITVAEVYRKRGWRREVKGALEKQGVKVIAINPLRHQKDGCDIAVTCSETNPAASLKRKPVTRGGQPIGEPKKLRTMATRRRG